MKDKTKKVAIGAAIAGAVGYIVGILTAPKSGKETRKNIHEAADKAVGEAEKKLKSLHSELNLLLEKAKNQSTALQDKGKQGLTKILEGANIAKQKARDMLSLAHEGTTDNKELEQVIGDVSKAIDELKTYLLKNENTTK